MRAAGHRTQNDVSFVIPSPIVRLLGARRLLGLSCHNRRRKHSIRKFCQEIGHMRAEAQIGLVLVPLFIEAGERNGIPSAIVRPRPFDLKARDFQEECEMPPV